MAALPDSQDVTLAFADSDLFQCWKKKVKQGRECSLLLEHTNGKVTTTFKVSKDVKSDVKAPKTDSKSLAEKKKQPRGGKKLAKLLAYHKSLVDDKGLPPSNLMVQHAAEMSSPSPPAQKPRQEGGSPLKCDQCDKTFKSKQKLGNHIRNKHTELQKPEEFRGAEAETSLNVSVSSEERSLPLNNSIVKADTPVKIDNEKSNTYSRLEKAASYDERDQEELDRVSSIIDETGNCEFCNYSCPNPSNTSFDGPPDIWDHMEKHHPKEYEWFA